MLRPKKINFFPFVAENDWEYSPIGQDFVANLHQPDALAAAFSRSR